MGKVLNTITGYVTAPSTTLTALTMSSGDTLTVLNGKPGKRIHLIDAFADNQSGGQLRIRSPKMHDNVNGLILQVIASVVRSLFPLGVLQDLEAQDNLAAHLSGSGTAGDIESAALTLWYEDLGGNEARLIGPDDLRRYGRKILGVPNTLATGTSGGYSGEEAINAENDYLKANTEYALLGALFSAECLGVGYRGPDTGNYRVMVPGADDAPEFTSRYFVSLSERTGLPCIPVINSANKSATLLDAVQDENGTDVTVTTLLMELSPDVIRAIN